MTSVPTAAFDKRDNVVIFDTTMRDGEQSPGASMSLRREAGARQDPRRDGGRHHRGRLPDRLERRLRGRPRSRQARPNSTIAGLCRAHQVDIDRCAEALKPAQRGRIHVVIATSPVHMKHKLQMEPDAGHRRDRPLGDPCAATTRRRRVVGRGRHPQRDRVPVPRVETAIKAGATTINMPDTVGYTVPEEYADLFKRDPRERAELRQGDLLGALPQRPRHGGGQFAGRRARRRAAGRVHRQRHRRARRQRRAGRDRDGDQDPQRQVALLEQHRHHAC
jgi:2-isopropylmalate synthase